MYGNALDICALYFKTYLNHTPGMLPSLLCDYPMVADYILEIDLTKRTRTTYLRMVLFLSKTKQKKLLSRLQIFNFIPVNFYYLTYQDKI